jgi:hypothetical protein
MEDDEAKAAIPRSSRAMPVFLHVPRWVGTALQKPGSRLTLLSGPTPLGRGAISRSDQVGCGGSGFLDRWIS